MFLLIFFHAKKVSGALLRSSVSSITILTGLCYHHRWGGDRETSKVRILLNQGGTERWKNRADLTLFCHLHKLLVFGWGSWIQIHDEMCVFGALIWSTLKLNLQIDKSKLANFSEVEVHNFDLENRHLERSKTNLECLSVWSCWSFLILFVCFFVSFFVCVFLCFFVCLMWRDEPHFYF